MKCPLFHQFALVFLAISVLVAGTAAAAEEESPVLSGYGHWLAGQVVKGTSKNNLSHQWVNSVLTGFTLIGKPSERLTVALRPEFKIYYPNPDLYTISTRRLRVAGNVGEVSGKLVFGDIKNPYAELRLGVFGYKYNPDAKDLGEYLFRTGTYPPFVINNFDFAMARLCGMQLRIIPKPNLTVDVLLLSELEYYPLYDLSLAFLAEYKILNGINFGAGVDFARLIPIDPRKTNVSEKTPLLGSKVFTLIRYKKDNSDTGYSGYYSFKAIKMMARTSFDIKAFLPELDFFGKEDLKLYGEIALTGLPIKSVPDPTHPDLYGDITRLMPMVAGFNIPAFRLLDVLAVEIEYFPSRMPNNYLPATENSAPLPDILDDVTSYDPDDYKERDLGWAVYFKKEIIKGFGIAGQVAYDHMRLPGGDGYDLPYEVMAKHGDWAWLTKLQFSF